MQWLRSILLTMGGLLVSGCVSWTRIAVPEIPNKIQVRDTVRLQTMDGQNLEFVVLEVEPVALVGQEVRVLLGDIEWLELGEDHTLRNIGFGVLITGLVVVVLIPTIQVGQALGVSAY